MITAIRSAGNERTLKVDLVTAKSPKATMRATRVHDTNLSKKQEKNKKEEKREGAIPSSIFIWVTRSNFFESSNAGRSATAGAEVIAGRARPCPERRPRAEARYRLLIAHDVDLWWYTPLSIDFHLFSSVHHALSQAGVGGYGPARNTRRLEGAPREQQSRPRMLFHPSAARVVPPLPDTRDQAFSPGRRV
jgi:hypothetical protein